jgi:hypothetical protein
LYGSGYCESQVQRLNIFLNYTTCKKKFHEIVGLDVMVLGNQHKILLGLVLFLVVLLAYRVFNPYRQKTVSKLTYARTTKITPSPLKTPYGSDIQRPTTVMTALFKDPPRVVVNTQRDPFRKATTLPPARAIKPINPRPPPPTGLSALEQAKERLGRFKAFGSFSQGERASLFLQRGKQVLVISAGDRLDGKFKIESISGNTAVVSTSDIETPFDFHFEELEISDDGFDARPSASPPRAAPRSRPASAPSPARPPDPTPMEITDSGAPKESTPSSPPSLPEPPPTDSPTQPFSSKGSPSKSYLPGNKPPENN